MRKAVVVGGSNGIGMSITIQLLEKGYKVIIIDKVMPNYKFKIDEVQFIQTDLRFFDEQLFKKISLDNTIDLLMITAGFGRVCSFTNISVAQIGEMMTVNASSIIKIIKIFYDRIHSRERFYCGVMCSIAGIISSPLFTVYSASKAAIFKFIEGVNIELEKEFIDNRILCVSPGSIKGTHFNGEKNNPSLTISLADEIINRLISRKKLYIPNYDSVFKDVIKRYHENPHIFGLSSYDYKKESSRIIKKDTTCIGYLSGTFDLFHVGHLNLLKQAKAECDYLIVGVHPDASHKGKKTYVSLEERKKILESIKFVDKVVDSCYEDSDAWSLYHYNKLFVGSDYKGSERFNRYEKFLKPLGVNIVYFPYTKTTSSTQIRQAISKETGGDL